MAELTFDAMRVKPASTQAINRKLLIDERKFGLFADYRFGIYSVGWDEDGKIVKTVEWNPYTGERFAANRADTSMSMGEAVEHINKQVHEGDGTPRGLILYMPENLLCVDLDGTDDPATADKVRAAHYDLMEHAPTWIEKSVSETGRHAFYRLTSADASQLANTNNHGEQVDTRVVNGFVFLTGDMVRADTDFAPFASLPAPFRSYLFARCGVAKEAKEGSHAEWREQEQWSDVEVIKNLYRRFPDTAKFLFTKADQTGLSDAHFGAVCDLIRCSLNYEQVKRLYFSSEAADYSYRSDNRKQLNQSGYEKWLQRNIHGAAAELTDSARFFNPAEVYIDLSGDGSAELMATFWASEVSGYTPTEWIVQGVIPKRGVVAVYGASGSGKTFLTLDALAAVSNGQDWFGRRTMRVPVTYVGLEGEAGLRNRIYARIKEHGPLGDMLVTTEKLDLRNPDDVLRLLQTMRHHNRFGGIVCIDTMAKSAPGMDENSSSDMSVYIKAMETIAEEAQGCVLLVHHSGKDGDRGPRGHSSFLAGIDAAIQVVKVNGHSRKWETKKVKDGADDVEEPFSLTAVEIGTDQWGSPEHSCIIGPAVEIDLVSQLNKGKFTERDVALLTELMQSVDRDQYSYRGGVNGVFSQLSEIEAWPKHWDRELTNSMIETGIEMGWIKKWTAPDKHRNQREYIGICEPPPSN